MIHFLKQRLLSITNLLTPIWSRAGFRYTGTDAQADLSAGITVAVIQVPQSMAFAISAGLPAVYGLYASLFGFVASIWGSSRQLSTGPVAMVSLLTLTSLVPLATPQSTEFVQLAATLAFLTGVIYLILGALRLGTLVHLVPHSVIAGFSTAVSILIIISQIPALLGIPAPQYALALQNVLAIIRSIPHISTITALIGVCSLGVLIVSKSLPRAFPGALLLMVATTVITYLFGLDQHGVTITSTIPRGLPSFALPALNSNILTLLPKAAVIAVVAFVSTHANAKTLAQSTKEVLNTDQELIGQGLANVITSLFQGFPIAGSFTRSAINQEAGASTGFASLVSSVVTVIVVLFFTPLFYYLPKAALAAIVILAAYALIDFKRLISIYRTSYSDGFVAFITFAMVGFMRPEDALLLGIIVALAMFIRQTVWGMHVIEVGVDNRLHVLRALSVGEDTVRTYSGILICRMSMSLYYANTGHMIDEIDRSIMKRIVQDGIQMRDLVIDMSGVHYIDITGLELLTEYIEQLHSRGIRVWMIYVRHGVRPNLLTVPHITKQSMFHNIDEMRQALSI